MDKVQNLKMPERVKNIMDIKEMEIFRWFESEEKFLNFITLPYSRSDVFRGIILYGVQVGLKVLYITSEDTNIHIIQSIKIKSTFRNYTHFNAKDPNIKNYGLVISEPENVQFLNQTFDLVIYDDISSFSKYTNEQIRTILRVLDSPKTRFITFAIESIFEGGRDIILPVRKNRMPIVEPRLITTRLDIKKNIPYVVYDFLSWSMRLQRKLIIYTPDAEKAEAVFKYIKDYRTKSDEEIELYISEKDSSRKLSSFISMKKGILVTDSYKKLCFGIKDLDVMVYFADDENLSYKKLIYFCGKVGRSGDINKGEIIFLANSETEEISKAKDIARNFNKMAWELGLLNI